MENSHKTRSQDKEGMQSYEQLNHRPFANVEKEDQEEPVQKSKAYNYALALIVAFGGFYLGYNVSIFNPFGKGFLATAYSINDKDEQSQILGNINLFFCIGCMIGAFTGGYFAGWFGKVSSILIIELIRIIVYVGYFFCPQSLWILYITRVLCGFTVGNFNTICPATNKDLLPKSVQSFGGVMFYGGITTGILMTSLFGSFIDADVLENNAKWF